MEYGIASTYISRNTPHHFVDIPYKDEAQKEVYDFCNVFMKENNLRTVVDVGCGSGYKLIHILGGYDTIGIETEPCYSFLKQNYPNRKWLLSGEQEKDFVFYDTLQNPDMVVCSDVIEHIVNPDLLVDYLLSLKAKYYIISTPCREALCTNPKFHGFFKNSWNGPPLNECHVREWTMTEFKNYIGEKFNVISSHYGEKQGECQYHLLTAKSGSAS